SIHRLCEEPTGSALGQPDDKLPDEAIQLSSRNEGKLDCFASLAMTAEASSRPLLEGLAQRDVALLLLRPVAAAGDGAVDDEVMAVDERGFVAGQEHGGMRNVVG